MTAIQAKGERLWASLLYLEPLPAWQFGNSNQGVAGDSLLQLCWLLMQFQLISMMVFMLSVIPRTKISLQSSTETLVFVILITFVSLEHKWQGLTLRPHTFRQCSPVFVLEFCLDTLCIYILFFSNTGQFLEGCSREDIRSWSLSNIKKANTVSVDNWLYFTELGNRCSINLTDYLTRAASWF